MPGLGDEGGEHSLLKDDDAGTINNKVIQWSPRRNLGIGWSYSPRRWENEDLERYTYLYFFGRPGG
jgi:hypothetical protein